MTAKRFANEPVRLASDPAPTYVGACVLLLFDLPESKSDAEYAVRILTRYAERIGLRVSVSHLTPSGDRSIYDRFEAETAKRAAGTPDAAGATLEHQANPGRTPDALPRV